MDAFASFTPVTVGDRICARSASDDTAPIVALLAAIDALAASNIPITSNVRVVMEGEEEAGSPNLAEAIRQHVPTIGLSLVNFDNNQHGPNENLRIQNLWEGIETLTAILTMK